MVESNLYRPFRIVSFVMIAGGWDGRTGSWVDRIDTDTILEYDITGDSIRKIGKMREVEAWNEARRAISVVKSADFSQWWVCP